jgi:hypothetical protein
MLRLAPYHGKTSHINSCTTNTSQKLKRGIIGARKLGLRWWPAKLLLCFFLRAPLSSSRFSQSYKSRDTLIFLSWLRCYFFNVVTSSKKQSILLIPDDQVLIMSTQDLFSVLYFLKSIVIPLESSVYCSLVVANSSPTFCGLACACPRRVTMWGSCL